VTLPVWTAGTAYLVGARVTPVVADGTAWLAEVAGTSGISEPVWPTIAPWTVVDGGVTWGLASTFRARCVSGVYTVLSDLRTANPTLLKGLWKSRPKSMTNLDLPGAYLGTRREAVTHSSAIRQTTLSIPVTFVVPVPDNAEAETFMDDLMDAARDAFTLNYHAASGFSITAQDSADEGDEPEGGVPYLANSLVIVNTIAEGRQ
jgi:hypothetical protein